VWFLPTRPMRQEESVLPTYTSGDGRWRAGDGEVVRATLVDGRGGFWWSSGSGVNSRVGGGGRESPSMWWLDAGIFGVAGRRRRLALL
jgi:hypothetical protein